MKWVHNLVHTYFDQLVTIGGICVLVWSVYQAVFLGEYGDLLQYAVMIVLALIVYAVCRLFPDFLRGKIESVNRRYGVDEKVRYVEQNHEQWLERYTYHRERFIFLLAFAMTAYVVSRAVLGGCLW